MERIVREMEKSGSRREKWWEKIVLTDQRQQKLLFFSIDIVNSNEPRYRRIRCNEICKLILFSKLILCIIGLQVVYNANRLAKLVKKVNRWRNWLTYYETQFERDPEKRPRVKVFSSHVVDRCSNVTDHLICWSCHLIFVKKCIDRFVGSFRKDGGCHWLP